MAECNCCAGSNCEPTDEQTCQEIHGDCTPTGGCLAKKALVYYLDQIKDPVLFLFSGGTFNKLDELRDRVLKNTRIGEQLLEYNRAFADDGMTIVQNQPMIFKEAVHAFLLAASFSRAMLRELENPGSEKDRVWTAESMERVNRVIGKLMELTHDEKHTQALRQIQYINSFFANRNPREVLDFMQSNQEVPGAFRKTNR